jgi:hypothetical protein
MSRALTVAGYAVLALSAVGLEIAARRWRRVATLGAAVSAAVRQQAVRVAILSGWLWLGWHLFVRVSWR